jgi:acyl-CoA thioester hydrolase
VGAPFRHRIRVRWAECDQQGVVFYANYLAYFDIAITELWRDALGSYDGMIEAGTDMVVAEASVRYRAGARFDDELDLVATVIRLGTTSVTTALAIERVADGAQVVEGELRHVFVEAGTVEKKAIPDDIRRALEPYAARPRVGAG